MDSHRALQHSAQLLDIGRPADAEQVVREALTSDPQDADLLAALAHALLQQDRHVEACDAARAALQQQPEHLRALSVFSAALAGEGRFPEAGDIARRGQALAPSLPLFHRQEAMVLYAQDRPREALAPLHRARTLDPHDADTMALLAAVHLDLRDYPQAQAAVDESLALNPQNPDAHRVRGLLALHRGGGREAVSSHREAMRLDPQSQAGREQLAVALKTRNPLYGALLRFGLWMETLPEGARLAILFAPLIANRVLRSFEDQLWAKVLLAVLIGFVALTWALEPLMNLTLMVTRFGRSLMPRAMQLATLGFLAYLVAALAALGRWFASHHESLLLLAVALLMWGLVTGQAHSYVDKRRREGLVVVAIGAVLCVLSLPIVMLAPASAGGLVAIPLVAGGLAMLWSALRG